LTACAPAQEAPPPPPPAEPADTQPAPAPEPVPVPEPEVTEGLSGEIVVATWGGDPFQSTWRALMDQFEAATGVTVIMDAIPWGNLREVTALEIASGSGAYDVIYVHPFWFEEFAANGYMLPVVDYTPQDVIDLFVPNLMDLYKYEGVFYGLPDFICTHILVYRTDLFEEAGLAPPESWDDILHAAELFADGDNMYGITFPGSKGGALQSVFMTSLVSNGGWFFDSSGNPSVNTPEAIETAGFINEMSKFAPPGFMNFHWDDNGTLAASGKAAMAVVMNINEAWLEDPEMSTTVGNWGYIPIRSNKGTPGGVIDSYCWSVTSDSNNVDAAAALVQFLAGTEAQVFAAPRSGTAGATIAFYEDEALLRSSPSLIALSELFVNSKPTPSWRSWSEEGEALGTDLQEMMMGNMTPEDVMARLQTLMSGG